ncbi:PREDICTED: ubiquitin carboxyl-terminal hydrolase 38-like [Acropora digitifera]|uniref:ubiquitin carboxyl-terminal hydrolase 38-like n=1 Tax=Acropora digitifera TaxID=70779 RepID=UPI00077A4800|nr:PREDICTED: ubiquitin carboxyl-terminal hydrolase 38-like [Acropora digitifera]
MEQLLRGIVASDHSENVKKSLMLKLVSTAGSSVADDLNQSIFQIGTEWLVVDTRLFVNEMGKLLLTTWAKRHKDVYQKYFTEGFLLSFLDEREQMSSSCIEYLRVSFELLQHSSNVISLYTIVRQRAHLWVEKNSDTDFCAAVARLLIEYNHCWPVGDNLHHFNLSLIEALSKTELPKTSKEEMKACLQNGAVIGALLNKMWIKNQGLVFPVLREIFKIISTRSPVPSVALASVVQYFSSDIVDSATNLVAVNPSVSDESLALSLTRMINWLSWPGVRKVDQWIIAFLKALSNAQKHSILISVTLKEVCQVFGRLSFPVVRESTMVVLSHMLLRFQHSPQAFHEVNHLLNISRSAFAPSKFLQVARPPWFAPGTQQDCSEFLKFLLDRISDEDKALGGGSEVHPTPKTCIVDHTFAGKLVVCLCCRRCNNSSCREEKFTDLPLAFPQAGELEGRVDQAASLGAEMEHEDVASSADNSSASSSERSLKGGDISHITTAPDLTSTTNDDRENVAGSSAHGHASADSSMAAYSSATKYGPDMSITELLEYFFQPEILQGSNQYHCEQCNSLQDAERTVSIAKPAEILVLTLKRFAYNVRTQQRSKILQTVSYPLILSLPRAHVKDEAVKRTNSGHMEVDDCSQGIIEEEKTENCFRSKRSRGEDEGVNRSYSSDTLESFGEEKPATDIVYSLCSVIVHSGTSSESGHYYCYARSSAQIVEATDSDEGACSRTTNEDSWFLFNDSRVSFSAYSSFAGVSKRFPKDTPYVLIYKRVSRPCDAVTPICDLQRKEIRQELAEIVNRDNLVFLQEQERQAVIAAKRKAWSHSYQPRDDDDDDNSRGPPGSCGSGPGLTTPFNRFVF